jgi:hypothetical protein
MSSRSTFIFLVIWKNIWEHSNSDHTKINSECNSLIAAPYGAFFSQGQVGMVVVQVMVHEFDEMQQFVF